MNDTLLFSPQTSEASETEQSASPWKVLIVDDEQDIHSITKLALSGFEFNRRRLNFYHAYSGLQAKEILQQESELALVLLDVVMETEDAGLEVARYIRDELNNSSIRIVLRTGQPGLAPEHKVIQNYDINDYKDKTELTATKLFTLIYSCLRAYRDITILEKSKKGLEKLVTASRNISSRQALNSFTQNTLLQLETLLNLDDSQIFSCQTKAFRLEKSVLNIYDEGNTFKFTQSKLEEVPGEIQSILSTAIKKRKNIFETEQIVIYCENSGQTLLFYAKTSQRLSDIDKHLLNMFTENLIVIMDNIHLNEIVTNNQKEVIYRLGEVVESRSNETGNHVRRVAHYSKLLAILSGMDEEEAELLKQASPLHDIGKIGIPDSILKKPDKLTEDEWHIMQTHAEQGYKILQGSELMLMNIGATIAISHHEKWDGSGYPYGLSQEKIPLYGRITALADIFDALNSKRCYKQAWPLEEVLDLIHSQSGKHFDPSLVRLLFDHLEDFLVIKKKYQDPD